MSRLAVRVTCAIHRTCLLFDLALMMGAVYRAGANIFRQHHIQLGIPLQRKYLRIGTETMFCLSIARVIQECHVVYGIPIGMT